jgi:hypothetical protein
VTFGRCQWFTGGLFKIERVAQRMRRARQDLLASLHVTRTTVRGLDMHGPRLEAQTIGPGRNVTAAGDAEAW